MRTCGSCFGFTRRNERDFVLAVDGKFVGVLFDVMLKFKAVVRGLDDAEARAGPCRAGDLREVGVHLQVLDDSECNADGLCHGGTS